jgi:hypothetical protein
MQARVRSKLTNLPRPRHFVGSLSKPPLHARGESACQQPPRATASGCGQTVLYSSNLTIMFFLKHLPFSPRSREDNLSHPPGCSANANYQISLKLADAGQFGHRPASKQPRQLAVRATVLVYGVV